MRLNGWTIEAHHEVYTGTVKCLALLRRIYEKEPLRLNVLDSFGPRFFLIDKWPAGIIDQASPAPGKPG